jgi:hypothetical protein
VGTRPYSKTKKWKIVIGKSQTKVTEKVKEVKKAETKVKVSKSVKSTKKGK